MRVMASVTRFFTWDVMKSTKPTFRQCACEANLKNTLFSMAALMIIEYCLYRKVADRPYANPMLPTGFF
jgi:hypothetical protein